MHMVRCRVHRVVVGVIALFDAALVFSGIISYGWETPAETRLSGRFRHASRRGVVLRDVHLYSDAILTARNSLRPRNCAGRDLNMMLAPMLDSVAARLTAYMPRGQFIPIVTTIVHRPFSAEV